MRKRCGWPRGRRLLLVLGISCIVFGLTDTRTALAGSGVCGAPVSGADAPTPDDVLRALATSAGAAECALCECDVDGDSRVTVLDALRLLRRLAGQAVVLSCAACAVVDDTPPLSSLPVVVADDLDADGDYDQRDIDLAMQRCSPGCNLELLPVTYSGVALTIGSSVAAGFSLYGAGADRSVLEAAVTPPGASYRSAIVLAAGAPSGIVLRDFTLDGLKGRQSTATQLGDHYAYHLHQGIWTRDPGSHAYRDGVIRRVNVRNFLRMGMQLEHVENWVVEDCVVTDIGCHAIDLPCGPAWDGLPQAELPHSSTAGMGIHVGRWSRDVTIQRNTVAGASKYGIALGGQSQSCIGASANPTNILIRSNTVERAGHGIGVNGGCDVLVEDNVARNNGSTGSERLNTGHGFTCYNGGLNSTWRRNRAINNQINGYDLRCRDGNVEVIDNFASQNCRATEYNNGDFHITVLNAQTGVRDTRIVDNVVVDTNCFAGLYLQGRDDVLVSGGAIEGGWAHGVYIESGENVEFRDMEIVAGPRGGSTGVFCQGQPAPVRNVFIQPSALLENFANRLVAVGASQAVFDCASEAAPPARCDNANP